jgi:hypothetical protein
VTAPTLDTITEQVSSWIRNDHDGLTAPQLAAFARLHRIPAGSVALAVEQLAAAGHVRFTGRRDPRPRWVWTS